MNKGNIITVNHNHSGKIISYLVAEDCNNKKLKLVNLDTSNIMANFETDFYNKEDIVNYIERVINCTIISVGWLGIERGG